jgi:hypothetical protein
MSKSPEDNTGSGTNQPDPRTLREKVGGGVEAMLAKKSPEGAPLTLAGNGTQQRLPQ